MRIRLAVLGCLLGLFALGVSACGSDDDDGGGGGGGGDEVTIYSSLPKQGASRVQAVAIENGAKLALEEKGGKAGKFKVKFVNLDDATAQAGKWDAAPTSANARKAAQDQSTVAVIGEYNSGASAISMPILNEAAIPQVSPANTAVGLTTNEPGAEKGEPNKYYPTGKRHYLRVVPRDTIQGAALATLMKEDGCKSVYIVNDKEVYGAGLATNIENSAKEQGLDVKGNDGFDPKAPNYRSLASKIKGSSPDCLVQSQVVETNGVQMTKDLAAANPDAKIYGPDGLAISSYADSKEGGIPANLAKNVKVTVATLAPDEYPPEGQKFFADYKKKYGGKDPDPYSIYGYECMSLVLNAIEKAGDKGNDKAEVLTQLQNTKDRKSVLGTYSIDKNGDSTIIDYGAYTIDGGSLKFAKTLKGQP